MKLSHAWQQQQHVIVWVSFVPGCGLQLSPKVTTLSSWSWGHDEA